MKCPKCGSMKIYCPIGLTGIAVPVSYECGTPIDPFTSERTFPQSDRCRIAELEAENAKLKTSASAWLKRENDKLKAQLATEIADWAETDTHIRNVARPILGAWLDGDSDSVPSVGDIVERLVHLLTAEGFAT